MSTKQKIKFILVVITLALFVASILFIGVDPADAASFNIDDLNLQEVDPQQLNRPEAYFKIGLKEAWGFLNSRMLTLARVSIGVVDTGLDSFHPEFFGLDFGQTPPSAKIDIGINGGVLSHGTNVVGIIGANNISATSSQNYVFPHMNGIVSGVHDLDYRLEARSYGKGLVDEFSALKKTFELAQAGVNIINLSFGNFVFAPQIALITPFYDATFRAHPNVLFVVAAGNNNTDAAFIVPANLGFLSNVINVITVGASALNDQRLSGSNFGSVVSISAPGERVFSPTFFVPPLGLPDYSDFSGTSASAPLVTGVAAILKAIDPSLTPTQIKNILIQSADPISTDKPIGPRLNALRAVQELIQSPTPTSVFFIGPAFRFNTAGYFNIVWERNNDPNFASYKIFRATHPNVTTADTLVATLTNQNQVLFRDEGLAPGTYFYKVFVFNQAGFFSPSNEVFGRIFGGADILFRIPGVPEPGDTNFPPNVAIPDSVFNNFRFDCPRSIFNPDVCVGSFTTAGFVIDESGHVSKFRRFSTDIINNKFNNVDNFRYITHNADEFRFTWRAVDDSYTVFIDQYGIMRTLPIGTSFTSQTAVFSFPGHTRFAQMFITNSQNATNDAGFLETVP